MKFVVLIVLFLPLLNQAQDYEKNGVDTSYHLPIGLDSGTVAPRIQATTISGEEIDSEELLKEKRLVIIFYRGQWCPVCIRYLSNLNDSISYITELNTEVLIIGPESVKNGGKTEQKVAANMHLISDTTLRTLKDYDVLFKVTDKYQKWIKQLLNADIAKNNSSEEAFLPIPATYVVNREGIIIFKQFEYDYHDRSHVKHILNALK